MNLSDPQRALLIRAVEDKSGDGARAKGAGGVATARVLYRHGLVARVERCVKPTKTGRQIVESWKCAACGHYSYHCPAGGCNHYDEETAESGDDSGWCDCDGFVASEQCTDKALQPMKGTDK